MKKLINNTNPFMLLLVPILFVMVMGVSYQIEKKGSELEKAANVAYNGKQATSLFNKSVTLFKAVCSVAKQREW
ncbi:hypothetical protein BDD43_1368 [Mucilaginibacter gracilis]|uniref:Uncharacterized protein n=1 Tax=Mucilaginibacter gracilis TaxID=423350 RepID=A0A495IXK0_9SPHI|nr:hypothetical protein [Mucilaginibacter gracilis]RKR81223.1 hypothetical protein BDD43_1368 [Mucilaginibacter gracilis]